MPNPHSTDLLRVTAIAIATLVSACGTAGTDLARDGRDAGRPPDANVPDANQLHLGPDTGPLPDSSFDAQQPDPVLPPQNWEVSLELPVFPAVTLQAAITIDARAEAGGTRAVIGANGRSSNVWFDVVRPGELVASGTFDLGTNMQEADCGPTTARITDGHLLFDDDDGDGVFERLVQLSGMLSLFSPSGVYTSDFPITAYVVEDATPVLVLIPERPLAGDTLLLVSSEPLDPGFIPFVEAAGLTYALTPTSGGSAPSRWTLALSELPPTTGCVLRAEGHARDLAGHGVDLPDVTFDVVEAAPVVDASFETSIAGVAAEDGVRVLGDAELPLEGRQSVFTQGRTVLTLPVPRAVVTSRTLNLMFRLHANIPTAGAPVVRIRDLEGRLLGSSQNTTWIDQPGTVPELALQGSPSYWSVAFTNADAITVEIDPWGSPMCGGVDLARTEPVGLTIDAISVI